MTPGPQPRAPDAGQGPLRVTTLELFLDLVFAFTLTQLTTVLDRDPTLAATGRVLLIFVLLWWMYGGYAWLTNARPPVRAAERILLLVGMTGFLIVGLAIPRGFGSAGVVLGVGYLIVVVVHAGLFYRVNSEIIRVVPVNVGSALLVTIAGLAGGAARYWLWGAALAVQLGSPLIVRPARRFRLNAAHLSERYSGVLIVALGESVAAIGIGASALGGRPDAPGRLILSAVVGLALAAALWWVLFGSRDDERAEHVLAAQSSERRSMLALAAHFYSNIPILIGLIAMAAGVQQAIAEPARGGAGSHGAGAAFLAVGAALFLAGDVAVRRLLGTGTVALRAAAVPAVLATAAAGVLVSLEVQVLLLTVVLVAMLLAEGRRPAAGGAAGATGAGTTGTGTTGTGAAPADEGTTPADTAG